MLHTTRALVLSFVRYGETSIIVRCYTEQFGIQSYVVNSVRTAKGSPKIAYYQPLSLLSLVAYHRPAADLNRISQVAFADPQLMVSVDVRKSAIRIFLAEVLSRVLKEQEANPELFAFVFTSLLAFEHADHDFENFHIQFLLGVAKRLGFGIADASELYHQVFQLSIRGYSSSGLARVDEQEALQSLMELPYFTPLTLQHGLRRHLLEAVVRYFRQHVEDMPELRSLEVLQEVFS